MDGVNLKYKIIMSFLGSIYLGSVDFMIKTKHSNIHPESKKTFGDIIIYVTSFSPSTLVFQAVGRLFGLFCIFLGKFVCCVSVEHYFILDKIYFGLMVRNTLSVCPSLARLVFDCYLVKHNVMNTRSKTNMKECMSFASKSHF